MNISQTFERVSACVQHFVTPRTVTRQPSWSMGFSRQEYWSGLPFPPAGDLPNSRIEPMSLALAGGFKFLLWPSKYLNVNFKVNFNFSLEYSLSHLKIKFTDSSVVENNSEGNSMAV